MSRRAARITHDEVVRMLKAARSMGLSIGSFSYDGDRVSVVINNGDSGGNVPAPVANSDIPQSLDEYKAKRDRNRARGN